MKINIFHDGFGGHVRRSLERAARMDAGEAVEPQRNLTLADAIDMAECFTVQRLRLWQVVKKQSLSISGLAEELGRNRGSVTRDVNKLRQFGLIRLREQVNPGHGKLQIVEPVAKKIEMHFTL